MKIVAVTTTRHRGVVALSFEKYVSVAELNSRRLCVYVYYTGVTYRHGRIRTETDLAKSPKRCTRCSDKFDDFPS